MADDAAQVSAFALRAGDPDGLWPLPEWLAQVADDEIYGWAVHAWRTAAKVDGSWFDFRLADAVVAEWPTWARLTSDRFAGVPFVLLPWQEMIIRLIVGWQMPVETLDPLTHKPAIEHVRLFRRLLLWVPRKNGKTEFLAALGLLFFVLDGLVDGEGYVFARDEEQARLPFKKMKLMASMAPGLQTDLIGYGRSIYSKSLRASILLLSGSDEGKHGKGPSVIVGDEMHEWRSLEVMNTLRQGTAGRLQPIELYGSTTGRKTNKPGMEMWNESKAILEGRIFDPTTLVVIFAAPPEADYRDEAAWRRSNPSLGLSPTLNYLRLEAAKCKDNPRAEAAFRCYHLNQWIAGEVRWIPIRKWDACCEDPEGWKSYPARLRGRACFGAADISSTQDITCLKWIFPPTDDDPKWRCISRYWVPEESVERRVKNDQVEYDRWVAMGALETTPGDYVDQNYVYEAILDGMAEYDVQGIGFDPWNARKLIGDLQTKGGLDPAMLIEMRQGIQTLGEPAKHFERLVFAGEFDHGGHPVSRWMAGNVVVRFDENLNYAPAKKRSAEKIDGIVADVMGVGLATQGVEGMIETGGDAMENI